ncbi:MAG: hypothetical protein IT359_03360 [Gemmatimonadaceae bacterium]|nr:hypothetical protein [Gemmatimonadaceae bacterium]
MTVRTLLVRLSLGATLLAAAPAVVAAQIAASDLRDVQSATERVVSAPSRPATPAAESRATPETGPRVRATIAGLDVRQGDAPLTPPVVASPRATRGMALTIVGSAAFLGGVIIGGDAGTVIAVGGLGVGVYGLWLWLGGK